MIVHCFLVMRSHAPKLELACQIAGYEIVRHRSLQEFSTALYRDPGSIGVYWSIGLASSLFTCREIRVGNVSNCILALLPDHCAEHTTFAGILNAGADDVQSDQIDVAELGARLTALGSRQRQMGDPVISFCGCTYNQSTGDIVSEFGRVVLTSRESMVMSLLLARTGAVVTKQMIFDYLYQGRDEPEIKIVDVFICKLRKKIQAVTGGVDLIETVWGRGHRFAKDRFREAEVAAE
ncbi:winged helix-turn-helix domain-containing protein [Mesorhizobium sp. ANAO-SY3R2]|uniref:winged helix-turn-helix domain-containing protein n=1 Tax=Mesorhizobium sp. ANAO-SY3R2 TaxID=3166644 RepID=UPI003671D6FF